MSKLLPDTFCLDTDIRHLTIHQWKAVKKKDLNTRQDVIEVLEDCFANGFGDIPCPSIVVNEETRLTSIELAINDFPFEPYETVIEISNSSQAALNGVHRVQWLNGVRPTIALPKGSGLTSGDVNAKVKYMPLGWKVRWNTGSILVLQNSQSYHLKFDARPDFNSNHLPSMPIGVWASMYDIMEKPDQEYPMLGGYRIAYDFNPDRPIDGLWPLVNWFTHANDPKSPRGTECNDWAIRGDSSYCIPTLDHPTVGCQAWYAGEMETADPAFRNAPKMAIWLGYSTTHGKLSPSYTNYMAANTSYPSDIIQNFNVPVYIHLPINIPRNRYSDGPPTASRFYSGSYILPIQLKGVVVRPGDHQWGDQPLGKTPAVSVTGDLLVKEVSRIFQSYTNEVYFPVGRAA